MPVLYSREGFVSSRKERLPAGRGVKARGEILPDPVSEEDSAAPPRPPIHRASQPSLIEIGGEEYGEGGYHDGRHYGRLPASSRVEGKKVPLSRCNPLGLDLCVELRDESVEYLNLFAGGFCDG